MPDKKLTSEEIADAWKTWITSESGVQCMDTAILNLPEYQAKYLENRLRLAFMAGVEFAEGEDVAACETADSLL
jgi:hypothetical protein